MIAYLFSIWILHFIESVYKLDGISLQRHHALILDGYNSHIVLNVVQKAYNVQLDLVALPFHTSYALQPLHINVFKSFNQHFSRYKDFLAQGI